MSLSLKPNRVRLLSPATPWSILSDILSVGAHFRVSWWTSWEGKGCVTVTQLESELPEADMTSSLYVHWQGLPLSWLWSVLILYKPIPPSLSHVHVHTSVHARAHRHTHTHTHTHTRKHILLASRGSKSARKCTKYSLRDTICYGPRLSKFYKGEQAQLSKTVLFKRWIVTHPYNKISVVVCKSPSVKMQSNRVK